MYSQFGKLWVRGVTSQHGSVCYAAHEKNAQQNWHSYTEQVCRMQHQRKCVLRNMPTAKDCIRECRYSSLAVRPPPKPPCSASYQFSIKNLFSEKESWVFATQETKKQKKDLPVIDKALIALFERLFVQRLPLLVCHPSDSRNSSRHASPPNKRNSFFGS